MPFETASKRIYIYICICVCVCVCVCTGLPNYRFRRRVMIYVPYMLKHDYSLSLVIDVIRHSIKLRPLRLRTKTNKTAQKKNKCRFGFFRSYLRSFFYCFVLMGICFWAANIFELKYIAFVKANRQLNNFYMILKRCASCGIWQTQRRHRIRAVCVTLTQQTFDMTASYESRKRMAQLCFHV